MSKKKEELERNTRKELGIVTLADVNHRKYKNMQQLEREKYLSKCEYQNFDHSDTSSDCSFTEEENVLIKKNQDTSYNIRLEKLFPKHLRRIRYHDIDTKKELLREEFLESVRNNPDKFAKNKGLREFFVLEQKQIERNEKKKMAKIDKQVFFNHPWLEILSPDDVFLPDAERKQKIREHYYDLINNPPSPDELINSLEKIKFIKWYEAVKNKQIEEIPFDPELFAIEVKGQIKKLKLLVKESTTKKKEKIKEISPIED